MTLVANVDVAIVGAGIAGASLAWALAGKRDVALLEAEAQPGFHATGRSAAFYAETYGGPGVQPLTSASKSFFADPPAGFADRPLTGPRGALHVAASDAGLETVEADFAGSGVTVTRLTSPETTAKLPLLADSWRKGSLWEPGCRDIDVAALHQGYLKGARRNGVAVITGTRFLSAARDRAGRRWRIETGAGTVLADILVNAAGAWADPVAQAAGVAPLGIAALRRTMIVAAIDRPVDPDWPLVIDAGGGFYFKPDAGHLWLSPHDETPAVPGDAQAEEIDIALAVHRFETAMDARVERVVRAWAGLRSFAPDRLPVYGFDASIDAFFWCAGQGGFGIQTAPAAAAMAARLILGESAEDCLPASAPYAPARFRR